MQRQIGVWALGWTVLVAVAADGQQTAPPGPERWEKNIAAFEAKDRTNPPPKDGVLFIGSSSIVGWKVTESFPGLPVYNRGFGGSYLSDSVHFAERIVLPYRPRLIVLYAGENDITAGKTPRQVADDFRQFAAKVHRALPKTRIVYIGLKPSPSRWRHIERFWETNRLIREQIESNALLAYVDVEKAMLGEDGKPREDLFVGDRLHMNEKGYKIWVELVKEHLVNASACDCRALMACMK